jgi:hypothetical protein
MKFRGLMLCAMLLSAPQGAWSEVLRVDAMRLSPDAPWRRGDVAREEEDGIFLLEWPIPRGVALQVALPRRATPLKADAETFRANLRRKWAAQYGRAAQVREMEIGGVNWLVCRRPGSDGDAIVFHLATVHDGRAYSLVAFAAPQAAGLPKPVYELLAAADFGPETRHWFATRVVSGRPGREALAALLVADAARLGENGMLTGLGVDSTELSDLVDGGRGRRLSWLIEGFRWRPGAGRDEREPLHLSGQLEARVPARAAGALAVSLHLAAGSAAGAEVEVTLLDLCAPPAELDDTLAGLERGAHAALERLARERPTSCTAMPGTPAARTLRAQPGRVVSEILEFPLPPAPPPAAGLAMARVLALRPRLVGGADALGQSLLHQSGLYFVYTAE